MSHRLTGMFSGRVGRVSSVTAVVVALVVFTMLSEGLRGYQADLSVLVIPGERAKAPVRDIVENVSYLSRTSKFQAAFFQDAESVPGLMASADVSEMSGDEMKASFESMISIMPGATGSMLSVRAFAADPDDAKALARTSALSLFRYASRYYDAETEADFRIVEGPSVSARLPNGFLLFSGSVAIGAIVAGILAVLWSVIPGVFRPVIRRTMPLPGGSPFGADIFQPKRPISPLLSETDIRVGPGEEPTIDEPVSPSDSVPAEDPFFEPRPVRSGSVGNETVRSDSDSEPTMKKAPAPPDIPTYSDEEERFLKEFSFETVEGDDTETTESGPETATAKPEPTVTPSVSEDTAVVSSDMEPSREEHEHPAPSKSDYQRRLNELLRG